jgi:hypothetical protein
MNLTAFSLEGINNPIITDAQPVALAAFHPIMRENFKPRSHFINSRLDAPLDIRRETEKDLVERRIINLERPAHGASRLAGAGLFTLSHFILRRFDSGDEIFLKLQLIFQKVFQPFRNLTHFCFGEALNGGLDLRNSAHLSAVYTVTNGLSLSILNVLGLTGANLLWPFPCDCE